MYIKKILFSISILILVSLACGFNFDLPVTTDIKTGPTVIDNISIENPDDPDAVTDITLAFGAGELKLSPGGDQLLVSGQATYNVDDLKPEITERDGTVKIETGNLEIDGFPNFTDRVINIASALYHPRMQPVGEPGYADKKVFCIFPGFPVFMKCISECVVI